MTWLFEIDEKTTSRSITPTATLMLYPVREAEVQNVSVHGRGRASVFVVYAGPDRVHVRCLNCESSAAGGRRLLQGNTVDVRVIIDPSEQQQPGLETAIQRIQDSALTNSLQQAGMPFAWPYGFFSVIGSARWFKLRSF